MMRGQTQIKFTDIQRSKDLHVHIRYIYCKNHTCVVVLVVICVVMRGDPQQAIMRYAALVGEQKWPAA